jgi:ADP-heptose:LPS heptosyltransferase
MRVGLIWSAGAWDPRRSMRLSQFEPLMRMPEFDLVVLQRGPARAEAAQYRLPDLGSDDIDVFASTLAALDLLVCVDTFGAHLAGAMNIPAFVLLHTDCDWRWMSKGRISAWYPSLRLYCQPSVGDWDAVVSDVVRDVRNMTQSASAIHDLAGTNPFM